MDWQKLVAERAKADALGMPSATATDNLAMMRADMLLPRKKPVKKSDPLRLAALQQLFPMVARRPNDAQGGMT